MDKSNHQSGNVLFLILIAVALFAALSYAITTSSRGGGDADTEKAALDSAVSDNCVSNIQAAQLKISLLSGCDSTEFSYELEDGTNPNALSPVDESCHVFRRAGGGAYACGTYLVASGCDLTALASIGDACGGTLYAGMQAGTRLYVGSTDLPDYDWATATSECGGLGADWYLPNSAEHTLLHTNRASLGGFNAFTSYWSSDQIATFARVGTLGKSAYVSSYVDKTNTHSVRCVRRD